MKFVRAFLLTTLAACGPGICTTASGAEPPELAPLRDAFEKEIAPLTRPEWENYLTELQKSEQTHVDAREYEAAAEVRRERVAAMERLGRKAPPIPTPDGDFHEPFADASKDAAALAKARDELLVKEKACAGKGDYDGALRCFKRAADLVPAVTQALKADTAQLGPGVTFDRAGAWIAFTRTASSATWRADKTAPGVYGATLLVATGGPIAGQGGTFSVTIGSPGTGPRKSVDVAILPGAKAGEFVEAALGAFEIGSGGAIIRLVANSTKPGPIALVREVSLSTRISAPATSSALVALRAQHQKALLGATIKPRAAYLEKLKGLEAAQSSNKDALAAIKLERERANNLAAPPGPEVKAPAGFKVFPNAVLAEKWYDGDNQDFTIDGQLHHTRLYGIDAPDATDIYTDVNWKTNAESMGLTLEEFAKFGKEARDFVRSKLQPGRFAVVTKGEQDNRKRELVFVVADGIILQESLIERGLAVVAKDFAPCPGSTRPTLDADAWKKRLADLEKEARSQKVGLWQSDRARQKVGERSDTEN